MLFAAAAQRAPVIMTHGCAGETVRDCGMFSVHVIGQNQVFDGKNVTLINSTKYKIKVKDIKNLDTKRNFSNIFAAHARYVDRTI